MLNLGVVIASTRPGRVGLPVGQWFFDYSQASELFDVRLLDLAEFNLPLLDEPFHPRLKKYQHDHTKRWSEAVDACDAFVFVTPEYNFGPPAALINALDYVYSEWNFKAAAFISYGGVSGGLRSVQMSKQILTTLNIMPIPDAVVIPFVSRQIEDGSFKPEQIQEESANILLRELARWAEATKTLRSTA